MYCDALREQVSQGDIFLSVPFVRVIGAGSEPTVTIAHYAAILLTHNCEYDKPRVEFVLMARVRPLQEMTLDTQGNIRGGRIRSTFYLPAREPEFAESSVDFYHIGPVMKHEIARLALEGQRALSLSDMARAALREQIFQYFARAVGPGP